ncbi:MAG TPA: IS110 family transposase [Deltaproteobacteria bacterium]|jgi:transposase|nr:IS110 family transposase [Deltaproteobacteria bacterium]
MEKNITAITIGLDVSDRFSEAYAIDNQGAWLESWRIPTKQAALRAGLARYPDARIVLEVGCHSPWISRQLKAEGFEVIVANPRRVRLIAESDKKSDRFDAEQLARLGRLDPGLLSPIVHRGERAQRDRVLLRARDGLVRARTLLINQVRGFAKSLGTQLPSSSCETFPKRVRNAVGEDLFPGLGSMLAMIEQLTAEIRSMDRTVERLCQEGYKETGVLRQVPGVGPLTALAFVLTLEDPQRFAKSRDVGAYLGLRPRQRDSGGQHPQLRITKAGDALLRRLLVTSAHYILGPFGPDTDLRRFGLRLAERGGKSAKKRAAVAVARKLAVLLHRLWITGEEYQRLSYGAAGRHAA